VIRATIKQNCRQARQGRTGLRLRPCLDLLLMMTLRRFNNRPAYFFGFDFDVAVGADVEVEFELGLFGKIGNPSRLP
jgi:hypothetical protein